MSKVRWKRLGQDVEDNVLIVFGYSLNDKNEFTKDDKATTMIRNLEFNDFTLVEFTVEVNEDDTEVNFKFGHDKYVADAPLMNGIMELAQHVLWNRVDAVLAETGDEELKPEDILGDKYQGLRLV